jgi:pimeloyl-ACP methyl ester carboxylesterase
LTGRRGGAKVETVGAFGTLPMLTLSRRMVLSGLAALAIGAVSGGAADAQVFQKAKKDQLKVVPATANGGRVIVLRGLANIWSRGMDRLAEQFEAAGVEVTLANHAKWNQIAADLIKQYKTEKNVAPIILVGHSLGADASLVMSNFLGLNNVPVRLVIAFDGVAETHPVIGTIQEVINYYKPSGYGRKVSPAKSFKGNLVNVDLTTKADINHLTIDKNPELQQETFVKVLETLNVKVPAGMKAPAGGATAGAPAVNQPVKVPLPPPRPKPPTVSG